MVLLMIVLDALLKKKPPSSHPLIKQQQLVHFLEYVTTPQGNGLNVLQDISTLSPVSVTCTPGIQSM